jgi:hypothetical protein
MAADIAGLHSALADPFWQPFTQYVPWTIFILLDRILTDR